MSGPTGSLHPPVPKEQVPRVSPPLPQVPYLVPPGLGRRLGFQGTGPIWEGQHGWQSRVAEVALMSKTGDWPVTPSSSVTSLLLAPLLYRLV